MHAENSNGTTVRTFSNFNLLRDHCTLLPFPSTLTSLCTPETTEWTVVDLDEEGGGEDKITCTSKCMVQTCCEEMYQTCDWLWRTCDVL